MTEMKTVLVVGGTSDVGRAVARAYAAAGWSVQLAGRDVPGLDREAADIATRTGVAVSVHAIDILDTGAFAAFADGLPVLPDTVVSVVGMLGEQARAETDPVHATTVMRSNFEGPALLLGLFAERFLARGHGTIVGVSSVAGERGRASNYVYGAAKAGFTAFLSGLRNRVSKRGLHVVTVKPGFIRTRMTAGMKLPARLTADPQAVGDAIFQAAETRRRDVIYVKPVWALVMAIIRALPETIFKRTKL